MKVELGLSNYATKADLKNPTGVGTSELAKKTDLTSLKLDVDELDIDNLKTVLTDLSRLSNLVDNDVVNKSESDKLVTKVNVIHTSGLKTQYNTDKSGLKKNFNDADEKIPDTSGIVKKSDYNAKITEIEGKIPSC